jgi:hypothetical protein
MRKLKNWLDAYVTYTESTEAPPYMRWWTGISCIAGALQRKAWIDQTYFKWFPNFYIIFVANPGIVSKTTTMDSGLGILRQVPTVHFGPDVITWQALAGHLEGCLEKFVDPETGEVLEQSALTFASGELGNLIKPTDKEMIDVYVSLWDGKTIDKVTKGSGTNKVVNPWVNIIGCTTPSWIADNFPEYMIGGGFTSRCVFVYADEKSKYIAYPGKQAPKGLAQQKDDLLHDLKHIAEKLKGEYKLSEEAYTWGTKWYKDHYSKLHTLTDTRFQGYFARKQTHMHKLAMVIAASQRDEMIILPEDLQTANKWLIEIEKDMPRVFSLIGRSTMSLYTEKFILGVHAKGPQGLTSMEAYRLVHQFFPDCRDYDAILNGALAAGYVSTAQVGHEMRVVPTGKKPGEGRGHIMAQEGEENVQESGL